MRSLTSLLLFIALLTGGCALQGGDNPRLTLASSVLIANQIEFLPHTGDGAFDNYLAVTLDLEPVSGLRRQIEQLTGQQLKHRGEAHITVITPPEYTAISDMLSIDEINRHYASFIQESRFQPVCVARSSLMQNSRRLDTWYIVVESADLAAVRTEVEHLYYDRGGIPPAFTQDFHPHITFGFTERDLYAEDGAIKNSDSCVYPITLR